MTKADRFFCGLCQTSGDGTLFEHHESAHPNPFPGARPVLPPQQFTFTTPLPLLSKLGGNARQHWSGTATDRRNARAGAVADMRNALGHRSWPRFPGYVRLHAEFCIPTELYDWDNMIAALQPIINAVKNQKVIRDDNVGTIRRITFGYQIRQGAPAVEITITEYKQ